MGPRARQNIRRPVPKTPKCYSWPRPVNRAHFDPDAVAPHSIHPIVARYCSTHLYTVGKASIARQNRDWIVIFAPALQFKVSRRFYCLFGKYTAWMTQPTGALIAGLCPDSFDAGFTKNNSKRAVRYGLVAQRLQVILRLRSRSMRGRGVMHKEMARTLEIGP